MASPHRHPRTFSDHDVIAWRGLARRGRATIKDVVAAHGVHKNAARNMLMGDTYCELPGALKPGMLDLPDFVLDPTTVPQLRAQYRSGKTSIPKLRTSLRVGRFTPTEGMIRAMLTGRLYPDRPGALVDCEIGVRSRQLPPEVVLTMRLQYQPPKVSLERIAKAYRLDPETVSTIVSGKRYPEVPGAVPIQSVNNKVKLDDAQVLDARRRFRAQKPAVTVRDLMAELDLADRNVERMLIGLSYRHVGEALTHEEMTDRQLALRTDRQFPQEVALFMRLQYRPGVVSTCKIAAHYGCRTDLVHKIVSGRSYQEVPCAVTEMAAPGKQRQLTAEQVEEARRRYATGEVSLEELSEGLPIGAKPLHNVVRGYSYKDLPGAVPETIRKTAPNRHWNGVLTDEQALFIRLTFDPEKVPVRVLADAYGVTTVTLRNLLVGRTYSHVPLVTRIEPTREEVRKLTDDQVRQARLWAYRGIKTQKQIAEWAGLNLCSAVKMIKGETYAHIPGAVSVSIQTLRRRARKRQPIKMRPIRFPDFLIAAE